MTKELLLKKGLLTPKKYYDSLSETNPERIAYETKLIVLGIDLYTPARVSEVPVTKGYAVGYKIFSSDSLDSSDFN